MLKPTAILFLSALALSPALCAESGEAREPRSQHRHREPRVKLQLAPLYSPLAYHYLWPWTELLRAAAAEMEAEKQFDDVSAAATATSNAYKYKLNVERFKPDELNITANSRFVTVEGKHKLNGKEKVMLSHFVQSFAVPADANVDQISATIDGAILTITIPKHENPATDRNVPIEVIETASEDKMSTEIDIDEKEPTVKDIKEASTTKHEIKNETVDKSVQTESATQRPAKLDDDLIEATTATHVNKIRKKELKSSTKSVKDNEVTKGPDDNGLDYALMEE